MDQDITITNMKSGDYVIARFDYDGIDIGRIRGVYLKYEYLGESPTLYTVYHRPSHRDYQISAESIYHIYPADMFRTVTEATTWFETMRKLNNVREVYDREDRWTYLLGIPGSERIKMMDQVPF